MNLVCGVAGSALLFLLVLQLVRRVTARSSAGRPLAASAARLAGVVTAAAFAFSPTLHAAVAQGGRRLPALALALAAFALLDLSGARRGGWGFFAPAVAAVLGGLGFADAPVTQAGWLFLFFLVTLPFLVAVLRVRRQIGGAVSGWSLAFSLGLGLLLALAVATPLAPGELLAAKGVPPVFLTAQAAIGAGVLAAFWWVAAKTAAGRFARLAAAAALLAMTVAVAVAAVNGCRSLGAAADERCDGGRTDVR